jgi:DNA-directed RNA polymerase specialized sigma24 family protein
MSEREGHKATWLKIIGGDKRALSDIYRQHYLGLTNYGGTISDDHDLVNDCFMQMLVEFWDKRTSLPEVENIRSYLMISLRRAILYKIKTEIQRDTKHVQVIKQN